MNTKNNANYGASGFTLHHYNSKKYFFHSNNAMALFLEILQLERISYFENQQIISIFI